MKSEAEEDEEDEEKRGKRKEKEKRARSTLLMEARDVYEAGPPCLSRAVDGFVRIGLAGVAWGAFMGSYDAMKEGHKGLSRAVYVTKSVARNGLGWGCFAGAYFGLNCGVENMRGKRDWAFCVSKVVELVTIIKERIHSYAAVILNWQKNASTSGAITGALLSVRTGSAAKMLCTAALVSAIATSIDFKHPVQYPPTVYDS